MSIFVLLYTYSVTHPKYRVLFHAEYRGRKVRLTAYRHQRCVELFMEWYIMGRTFQLYLHLHFYTWCRLQLKCDGTL